MKNVLQRLEITLPPLPKEWQERLDSFAYYLKCQSFSENSLHAYVRDVAHFLQWHLGQKGEAQPDGLTLQHALYYRQSLVSQDKKPSTINRHLVALRKFLCWAVDGKMETLLSIDTPTRLCPLGITKDEAQALVKAATTLRKTHIHRNVALVQLFLQTGLLVNEAAKLLNRDIDLHERSGSIHIVAHGQHKARTLPLPWIAVNALHKYIVQKNHGHPDDAFFLTERNTPLNVRSMQRIIHQLACHANILRVAVTPQTLRHTFALRYLAKHPSKTAELATLLGHETHDAARLYAEAVVGQQASNTALLAVA